MSITGRNPDELDPIVRNLETFARLYKEEHNQFSRAGYNALMDAIMTINRAKRQITSYPNVGKRHGK